MTDTTDPGSKSPDEIQRELEDERQRLRQTGQALQNKLSVGTVVDELLARTKDRGPDYAVGLGRTIRENPIPVALIGISLAWLMAGGQRLNEERSRHGRPHDLDDGHDYPLPARPADVAPPAPDPIDRPMAEPGPAGPLEDEPLRQPPPAVGPADPLRTTPGTAGDTPAAPSRPGPLAGATGVGTPEPRPNPLAGRSGPEASDPMAPASEEEPLRLGDKAGFGDKPDRPGHDPLKDEDEDAPLTLGEDSRSGGLRSGTPPPASRPLEGGESKRPWETDDKDRI